MKSAGMRSHEKRGDTKTHGLDRKIDSLRKFLTIWDLNSKNVPSSFLTFSRTRTNCSEKLIIGMNLGH